MIGTWIFSVLLLGFVVWSVAMHRRDWRLAQNSDDDDEEEYEYRRRQYRRRMQLSAMVAVVAVLLPASALIERPLSMTAYVFGLVLLVCWILLLAMADILANRHRLNQLDDDIRIAETKARYAAAQHHQHGPRPRHDEEP